MFGESGKRNGVLGTKSKGARRSSGRRLACEPLESRHLMSVWGLELLKVTSQFDTDGDVGGQTEVTVPAGSPVTATFRYSSSVSDPTIANFQIASGSKSISLEQAVVSGEYQTASVTLTVPVDTKLGTYNLKLTVGNDGAGGAKVANENRAKAVTVLEPDSTPPLIDRPISGTLGENGWYTSDVTVHWKAQDAQSLTSPEARTDVVSSDTAGTTLTFSSTSIGGTASDTVTIRRDATPPTITPPQDRNVEYGSPISFTFLAEDATSGLAGLDTFLPSATDLILDAGTHTFTAVAKDLAGNTSTASFQVIVEPKTLEGTITANDKDYDGRVDATIAERALAGVRPGDEVSYVGGTAAFADPEPGQDKPVTATGLALSGRAAHNYKVNTAATTKAKIRRPAPAPQADPVAVIERVQINDGSAQRSMVNSLTITFTAPVSLDKSAFKLINKGNSSPVDLVFTKDDSSGKSVVTLTFQGGGIVGGSLADGNYLLTIDVEGDGFGQGSVHQFGADKADKFFRYFGDSDGDRDVDGTDYTRIRRSMNQASTSSNYLWYFDHLQDGTVDLSDQAEFGSRIRKSLAWV